MVPARDPASTDALIPRRAAELVEASLRESRVVHIVGARQAGKSTLARMVSGSRDEYTLDSTQVRATAAQDPGGFVDGLAGRPVLIDEVQRVPDLLLEIKRVVDRDPRPGQFLLTGSARPLALHTAMDSLAGRVERIELWPCTQGELGGIHERFVQDLLAGDVPIIMNAPTRIESYLDRILAGGMFESIRRTTRGRVRWADAYLASLLSYDAAELVQLRDPGLLPRLAALVAGCVGGILVPARLASQLERDQKTIGRYLDVLELMYLLVRIPAWRSSLRGRVVSKHKPFIVDTALLARLLRVSGAKSLDARSAGALLENFVAMEIVKQASWIPDRVAISHFRDRDGREVDLILEGWEGGIVAVEVKSSVTIRPDDWSSLSHLRSKLGDRFVAGVVLHPGSQTLPLGDRLWAVPICGLWNQARSTR